MTSPGNKQFVKDVARQLERRRLRRRLVLLAALAAAIALAITYLTCGSGFGLGGSGAGSGRGSGPGAGSAHKKCAIRVSAAGITVDAKRMSRSEAVATCRAAGGADVVVTGDARQGDWDELRQALKREGIPIVMH